MRAKPPVSDKLDYHIILCQSTEGHRYYYPVEDPNLDPTGEGALVTRKVPGHLINGKFWHVIARDYQLMDGASFTVMTNGSWMTMEEREAFFRPGRRMIDIPWVTGSPPRWLRQKET